MDQQLLRTTALHEIYSKTCVSVGTGEHQHYTSLLALICWSKTNWSQLLRTIREETVDCRACAGPALNALDVHPASAAYSRQLHRSTHRHKSWMALEAGAGTGPPPHCMHHAAQRRCHRRTGPVGVTACASTGCRTGAKLF